MCSEELDFLWISKFENSPLNTRLPDIARQTPRSPLDQTDFLILSPLKMLKVFFLQKLASSLQSRNHWFEAKNELTFGSLSVHRNDEQLEESVHNAFDKFGQCVVKVRRDRHKHPFALVQYHVCLEFIQQCAH